MAAVSDLLAIKGRRVHVIGKTSTVYEAIAKMVVNNVGSLVVIDRNEPTNGGERPCGIITERDYLRRIALHGRSSRTTFVQEIMSTDLACVSPTTDVEECMRLITRRRIRHLPVLRNGQLVGLVSIGDVVRYRAQQGEHQVQELTAYIQGRYV